MEGRRDLATSLEDLAESVKKAIPFFLCGIEDQICAVVDETRDRINKAIGPDEE